MLATSSLSSVRLTTLSNYRGRSGLFCKINLNCYSSDPSTESCKLRCIFIGCSYYCLVCVDYGDIDTADD